MAKRPRLKGPGLYHHIYDRGNDRHPIFKGPCDYQRYLDYLSKYSMRYNIHVIAYALMEWHVHLFLYDQYGKISEFINVLHGTYAQIFNKIRNRLGHVFEKRFQNKVVDANNYGIWLSRYIHRQAVEAGLVERPENYPWTSYRHYIGMERNTFLKTEIILLQFGRRDSDCYTEYRKFADSQIAGPVNWKKIQILPKSIVGGKEFAKSVLLKSERFHDSGYDKEKTLELLTTRLGMSINELKNPKGREQKELRHEAIRLLHDEYDIWIREIARVLNMSPSAVHHVLKSNNRTPAP